jgi:hypothetical protein
LVSANAAAWLWQLNKIERPLQNRRRIQNGDTLPSAIGETVVGHPCGILKLDANSFLFTDDFSGVIYYLRKKDEKTKIGVIR